MESQNIASCKFKSGNFVKPAILTYLFNGVTALSVRKQSESDLKVIIEF